MQLLGSIICRGFSASPLAFREMRNAAKLPSMLALTLISKILVQNQAHSLSIDLLVKTEENRVLQSVKVKKALILEEIKVVDEDKRDRTADLLNAIVRYTRTE